MKNLEKAKMPPFLWALIGVVSFAPIVPLLQHFGKPELIPPLFCAALTIAATVKVCWDFRLHGWFWPTIVSLAIVNSVIVVISPWPKGWIPAPFLLVGCIVDLVLMLVIIGVIDKLSRRGGTMKVQ